jgi:hypothetical protein
MRRLWFAIACVLALAGLPAAAAPKAARSAFRSKQSAHFTIKSNLPAPFTDAFLRACEVTLDGYHDVFGFSLYPNPEPGDRRMVIWVAMKPARPGLPQDQPMVTLGRDLRIAVRSERALDPPAHGGTPFLLLVVRAFGGRIMTFDNQAFSHGFVDYVAAEVMGYLQYHLGDQAWPRRYDYTAHTDPSSLLERADNAQPGSAEAAAGLLVRLSQKEGRDTLSKALRLLSLSHDRPVPGTTQKVAALSRQLVNLTGDGEIAEMFRAQHISTVMHPVNVTAAEFFACADNPARCRLLCDRWGTNAGGPLEGQAVTLLFQAAPKDKPKSATTPEGLQLESVPGGWSSAWYQPSTHRSYLSGRMRILTTGAVLENAVVGPDGREWRRD